MHSERHFPDFKPFLEQQIKQPEQPSFLALAERVEGTLSKRNEDVFLAMEIPYEVAKFLRSAWKDHEGRQPIHLLHTLVQAIRFSEELRKQSKGKEDDLQLFSRMVIINFVFGLEMALNTLSPGTEEAIVAYLEVLYSHLFTISQTAEERYAVTGDTTTLLKTFEQYLLVNQPTQE